MPTDLIRALTDGPATARELVAATGLSQPTVSRRLAALGDRVVVGKDGRTPHYGLRRAIPGVPDTIPVFEVGRRGAPTRHVADLTPVAPDGFRVQSRSADVDSMWTDRLPWFLQDLRPAGYLGRRAARAAALPDAPGDIRLWTDDHVLRFVVAHGSDAVGAFVLGHAGLDAALAAQPVVVARADRAAAYVDAAADTLRLGPVGSSAAGEEPKFLAVRAGGPDGEPVLVKFSPPRGTPVSNRRADLLVAEHLALSTLRDHGVDAADSDIVEAGGRVFLEVTRFDRDGPFHRRGQATLAAIDAAHVGRLRSWTDTATALLRAGVVGADAAREVRARARFGAWIANRDMHFGNLSFHLRGARLDGLAPVYDMLPMHFAPVAGEVVDRPFAPGAPSSADADVARPMHAAALDFWDRVAGEARITADLRAIATTARDDLAALRTVLDRLPR